MLQSTLIVKMLLKALVAVVLVLATVSATDQAMWDTGTLGDSLGKVVQEKLSIFVTMGLQIGHN